MKQRHFIGDLVRLTGLPHSTIRYYQRRGLLPTPERRESGYREYSPGTIERLRFIRRGQELGFTLEEVSDLLSLRNEPDGTCRSVRRRAEERLKDIEQRIADLQRMRKELMSLLRACPSDAPLEQCPILGSLDAAGNPRH